MKHYAFVSGGGFAGGGAWVVYSMDLAGVWHIERYCLTELAAKRACGVS